MTRRLDPWERAMANTPPIKPVLNWVTILAWAVVVLFVAAWWIWVLWVMLT